MCDKHLWPKLIVIKTFVLKKLRYKILIQICGKNICVKNPKKNTKNQNKKHKKIEKKISQKSKKKSLTHYPIIALLRGSHGLSARRALRTLSSRPEGPKAGPKGRSLEVGARRAPRLLVIKYCDTAKRAPSAANNISINAVYLEQNHATSTLRRFTKPRPTSGI